MAHMAEPVKGVQVEVSGSQGIVIGDGNTVFQAFAGGPPAMASHIRIREFSTIVTERTRDFTGREFIFAALNELMDSAQPGCGYVVIKGEPGIGKTSLLAELVRRHGYVHHFNIASQNIRSARDFLANTCAQLVVRYGLEHVAMPPEAMTGSGFLSRVLAESVEKSPDHRVVLLVDALDEAEDYGVPLDANRLFLPATLPRGAFVVATSRELHDYRLAVDFLDEISLRDNDPRNREDITRYVHDFAVAHHAVMAGRLLEWSVTVEEFAELLTVRSQGNFMYLVAVLRDIRSGRLSPGNLDDLTLLPNGLRAYYQRHWRTMQAADPDLFQTLYEPVICMLAVTHEPVSAAALGAWTNLTIPRVRKVLYDWREFLNEERDAAGGPHRYRLYHASFQDFLRDEVGLGEYHDAIAAAALRKIPGL
jgi:hypothetical protein